MGKKNNQQNQNHMQYLVEYRISKYGNSQYYFAYDKSRALEFAKKVRELNATVWISEVKMDLELTEEAMK
jgi:hypothetical protein